MEILSKIMFAMTVIALIAGVFIGLGTADYSSGFNWKMFGICSLASVSCLVTGMIFAWMDSVEAELISIRTSLSDSLRKSLANSSTGTESKPIATSSMKNISEVCIEGHQNSLWNYKGDCPEVPRRSGENDKSYWKRVRDAGF